MQSSSVSSLLQLRARAALELLRREEAGGPALAADPDEGLIRSTNTRARKLGAPGSISLAEWVALRDSYQGICPCCRQQRRLTVDHVEPLSAGGANVIANVQPLCMPCNSAKGAQTIDYRAAYTFDLYRFAPERYIVERLGWQPWRGTPEAPGQAEILAAYAESLRLQHARRDEGGEGDPVPNTIRVESGHGIGKTTLLAGIVSHFFDCFPESIVYAFAPGYEQINDLLFKEIRKQRAGRGLPGRVLQTPEIKGGEAHFAKGRATNDAGGRGTERVQGQHAPYLLFVIDEAEGVADFVYDAIKSMASGGIAVVILAANPRTRTSRFHRLATGRATVNFRVSCIAHPNVLAGRVLIPGAVERAYVEAMIDDGETQHCDIVEAHDPDRHTFTLPWRPGVIYAPDAEFLFRVLGVAPANMSANTFCPIGRYEAAKARRPSEDRPTVARIGVDVARWGDDVGAIWVRHNGRLYRAARMVQQDTTIYAQAILAEARRLIAGGVTSLHIRVDGGGGFGGGVIDQVKRAAELLALRELADGSFETLEVNNNAAPSDPKAFADLVTEMYYHLGEGLQALALDRPPAALEADLCERTYDWVKVAGLDVKKLEPKKDFKRRHEGRSPDDGDGAALAAAPDHIFGRPRSSGADLVGFV